MGDVLTFKKPLAFETPEQSPSALAAAFYHQCYVLAMANAMNAKRANPAINLSKLIRGLTQQFAEDVMAQKVLEAGIEQNPDKLHVAEELEALCHRGRKKAPQPA